MGVAVGPGGSVTLADTYNHRVREVGLDGRIRTVAGTGTGRRRSGSRSRPRKRNCAALAASASAAPGRSTSSTPPTIASCGHPGGSHRNGGRKRRPGDAGDGGPARLAQLNQPSACALDSAGNLFIADTFSHRIRKVSSSGMITTVAGTGRRFAGDDLAATAASLNGPRGVAVDDGGNIFIADTANHRIRHVTPDGVIHTIAGAGAPGLRATTDPPKQPC